MNSNDNAFDQIQHGESPVTASSNNGGSANATAPNAANNDKLDGNASAGSSASQADYSAMEPGQTVAFENGLSITVNSIKQSKRDYDGSTITEVNITYSNAGQSKVSFNTIDWRAEDKNGAIRSITIYMGDGPLHSGALSPGGTTTGTVCFDGAVAKVYYYSSIVQSDSKICWIAE